MSPLLPARRGPSPTSRPRRRPVPLLAGVVVLAAVLGACGDEPRRTTEALRSDPRPAEPSGPSDTELPPREDDAEESPSTTAPSGEGSGDDDELCASMRDFAEQGATDDPDELIAALEEWRDLAPDDLRDDLEKVIKMVETLRAVDETDPSAIGDVFETLTDPELSAAIAELGRFATEECSVQLDTGIGGLPG